MTNPKDLPANAMTPEGLTGMINSLKSATQQIADDPRTSPEMRAQAQQGLAQFDGIEDQLQQVVDIQFVKSLSQMSARCYSNSHAHGFWPKDYEPTATHNVGRNDGEAIALKHSELSELLEAVRDGNPPSEKIPGFTLAEEELADLLIRTMDYAHGRGFRLAEAVLAKHAYNLGRPHKHGREF